MSDTAALSPCVKRCALDASGVCLGCGRTIADIVAWGGLDEAQRLAILRRLSDPLGTPTSDPSTTEPGHSIVAASSRPS